MTRRRTRVLVVEDSLTVRKSLVKALGTDPELEVVAEAEDGRKAIELCCRLRPDVVTMDMMLPVMSGLAATEYIMAHCPTPILIVSASVNRGELFKTYDALAAGAIDVLEKPRVDDEDAVWEGGLLRALKMVARIKVITHPRARLGSLGLAREGVPASSTEPFFAARPRCRAVAIGASTGGPAALVEILRSLPESFQLPVLVVIHLAEAFAVAFADWLDGQSTHRVSYATDGLALASLGGRVLLAPPNTHLVLERGVLRLTKDPERHSCRPSVDVLFESVARDLGRHVAGCLLTGMGQDGARGLLAVRQAGGITIAQDEESCVVYGMPREAALLHAAERVLPLQQISAAIASLSEREE